MAERRIVREQPASIRMTRHEDAKTVNFGAGHRSFRFGGSNQTFRFGQGHQTFRLGYGSALLRFGAGNQYFSK